MWLADPVVRQRIGDAGRQRYERNFTAAAMVSQYEQLYEHYPRQKESACPLMLHRLESVRTFFDSDARPLPATIGTPTIRRTCEQLSYLVRRQYVLSMLAARRAESRACARHRLRPGRLHKRAARSTVEGLGHRPVVTHARRGEGQRAQIEPARNSPSARRQVSRSRTRRSTPIICIGVMAYVEDDDRTVAEIARVLKPGGCAVIQLANRYAPIRLEQRLRWIVSRWVLRRTA